MRDRIDIIADAVPGAARVTVAAGARSEAIDALVALGYKVGEVNKLLGKLDTQGMSAEDIIRHALRKVAS